MSWNQLCDLRVDQRRNRDCPHFPCPHFPFLSPFFSRSITSSASKYGILFLKDFPMKRNHFIRTFFLASALAAFVTVAVLSASHSSFGMEMNSEGEMTGCAFMVGDQSQICTMTLAEHLSSWQKLFTAIPQTASLLLFILALGPTSLFWKPPLVLCKTLAYFLKLYFRRHPDLHFFHFLRELFSRGILHSKIYSQAGF